MKFFVMYNSRIGRNGVMGFNNLVDLYSFVDFLKIVDKNVKFRVSNSYKG